MADVESLLIEGFVERVRDLLASRRADFAGLGELELRECGAHGAEAAMSRVAWANAVGDSWPTGVVTEFLDVTRQALHKRLRAGTVLGVPARSVTWFPTWQFDREQRSVRPVVAKLVAAFREVVEPYDALVVASWATTVQAELEMTPAEWLEVAKDDEMLVRIAKRSANELAA